MQNQIDNTTLGLDKTIRRRSYQLTGEWFERQMGEQAQPEDQIDLIKTDWDIRDLIAGKENKYFTWDSLSDCSSADGCTIPFVGDPLEKGDPLKEGDKILIDVSNKSNDLMIIN